MSGRYYDVRGKPIDLDSWVAAFARQWRLQDEAGEVRVSTVYLGLDHNFSAEGPPLIFETMVFGGPLDDEQERYSTQEQATEGHHRWVQKALNRGPAGPHGGVRLDAVDEALDEAGDYNIPGDGA